MTEDTKNTFEAEKFAENMQKMLELGGKSLNSFMQPNVMPAKPPAEMNDMTKTLGKVAEFWLSDPNKTMQAQSALFSNYAVLWGNAAKAFNGEKTEDLRPADPKDNRFKAEEWHNNPLYDFIKQFYLVTSDWADKLVEHAELDSHTKHKAEFYTKQITSALSPSNFVLSNPEVLKKTLETNGENLLRGAKMYMEDLEKGKGTLKIRQSKDEAFEFGVNIAATKGTVIFKNELIELIHYAPVTEKVGAIPLLIVPPWINKFYILDLNPEKSFVKFCVEQGLSTFIVSWVNPDERHRNFDFASYMHKGILAALEQVLLATGAKQAHTIGYCVGGTLMATTLGYMAAKKDNRIKSTTFFTTQVDFTHGGDLKVFVDEEQIASVEEKMLEKGYLDGASMANAFNMLRSNDLIWSYAVKNYLKGDEPTPFDLLSWNADSTRMPAANHSFYLRQCYLHNNLSQKKMMIDGVTIDLSKVKVPIFNLATKEDHIAPAKSAYQGSSFFGGTVDYVMGGSGHIAGVVNPASKPKYEFYTGKIVGSFEEWVDKATLTKGSWWGYWREWIRKHDGEEIKAIKPAKGLYPAPGEYVKVKS